MGDRLRRVEDEREALGLLEECGNSGLQLAEFCAQVGVDGRSLNCWRRNLERRRTAPAAPQGVRFLEVVTARPSQAPAYRLHVGDLVIEVDDYFREDTLGRLLRVAAAC
jgi:hypothetical protein